MSARRKMVVLLFSLVVLDGAGDLIISGVGSTRATSLVVHGLLTIKVDIDNEDSEIWFNFACTGLTGDFLLQNGTLDVDQNIKTTGKLTIESVNGSHPRIEVQNLKSAKFRVPS